MATRPVLLTVDDDPQVVRAIGRDLRQQYGLSYQRKLDICNTIANEDLELARNIESCTFQVALR
jgi:thioredoxin reductase (NADPH)